MMDSRTAVIPGWVWAILVVLLLAFLGRALGLFKRRRTEQAKKFLSGAIPNDGAAKSKPVMDVPVAMVSYEQVKREYERRLVLLRQSKDELARLHAEVDRLNYRELDAVKLLECASAAERSNLRVILGLGASATPTAMVEALRQAGSHGVASLIRGGHVRYEEVVKDVALKLGAKAPINSSKAAELEKLAIGAAVEQMLAKASPDERKSIMAELTKGQSGSSAGLMTAAGGLILANLSGFGLYVAASSSLAAITGAVGLTLPFAVYTGMSSVLAAVTGPAGWAVILFLAIFKLGGADYKKTIPGVIAVASVRARLNAEREGKIATFARQQSDFENSGRHLAGLARFLDGMRHAGTDRLVPKASVPW